jgi:hypothetical protein
MTRLLLSLVVSVISLASFSQQGFLFVKKGFHKKRTYTEGDIIALRFADGSYVKGTITLLRNDTIFINDIPIPRSVIKEVIVKPNSKIRWPDPKTLLLIGAGVALTTIGLTLSKQTSFEKALTAGLVIGYGPLAVRQVGVLGIRLFSRKKFKIGKKFHLQVLDFHIGPYNLRPF